MFDKFRTRDIINSHIERPRGIHEDLGLGKFKNYIQAVIIRKDGSEEEVLGFNSRTNAGALWQANMMCGTPTTPANYIALSQNILTPQLTDTTLAGEITSSTDTGLVRTQGTFAGFTPATVLNGNALFQVQTQFLSAPVGTPAPGNPAISITINSAGMFDAAINGTLFVQANFDTPAVLTSGDRLIFAWVIGI